MGSTKVSGSLGHARTEAGTGEVALRGVAGLRRRGGSMTEWRGARGLSLRRLQVEGSSQKVPCPLCFFQCSEAWCNHFTLENYFYAWEAQTQFG